MRSHYDVLGVDQKASKKEIKEAYRKLVLKIHPDKNPDVDREAFEAVQVAYETLSDPEKKRRYDRKLNPHDLVEENDLDKENLHEFSNSSLEEIHQKLPEIIDEYTQKLKIKQNKEMNDLYANWQFLDFIQNRIFLKISENRRLIRPKSLFDSKSDKKLLNSFGALVNKFKNKCLLRTRKEMLILQDNIQEYIKKFMFEEGGERAKKFFDNKEPVMRPYKTPLEIEFDVGNYITGSNSARRKIIVALIQDSPIGEYLEMIEPPSPKSMTVKFKVKTDYFYRKTQDQSETHSQPEAGSSSFTEAEVSAYKNNLLAYIEKRSGQKKYTGWRFGYRRESKVEAAQSLIDLLSGRENPYIFFSSMNKTNLKALRQGKLKKVAEDALKYAERNLKPKR